MTLELRSTWSIPLQLRRLQDLFPTTTNSLPVPRPGMTLFCDFDGPIVDVSVRYYSTYCLALSRTRRHYASLGQTLTLTPMDSAQFWRMKQVRLPDPEIALRSGLRGEQVTTFLGQVKALVNHCPALLRRDRPQPKVESALQQLKQQGIRVVLVTLRCESQVNDFLRRHGFQDLFAQVYGTQDTEAAYQNYTDLKTSLLSQAVEENCSAADAWMVGDTEADIIAAQRLGLPSIALTCGIRSVNHLRALKPDAVYCDLSVFCQQIFSLLGAVADRG